MSKFIDPISNAKTLGFLYMLTGAVSLLSGFSNTLVLFIGFIQIIIGYGLRKTKLWALYLIGGLLALRLIFFMMDIANGVQMGLSNLISVGIDVAIFAWLFSARKRMVK